MLVKDAILFVWRNIIINTFSSFKVQLIGDMDIVLSVFSFYFHNPFSLSLTFCSLDVCCSWLVGRWGWGAAIGLALLAGDENTFLTLANAPLLSLVTGSGGGEGERGGGGGGGGGPDRSRRMSSMNMGGVMICVDPIRISHSCWAADSYAARISL